MRVTLEDLALLMVKKGVPPDTVKELLKDLGATSERIEKIMNNIPQEPVQEKKNNKITEIGQEKIAKELMSMSFEIVRMKSTIEIHKSRIEGLETRVSSIEARFEALSNILIEYAPFLFKRDKDNAKSNVQ
jgi:archaellum component FlaC